MRKSAKRLTGITAAVLIATGTGISPANADAAKPGQSMTHMKTLQGITATLENSGVILYVQGGATSAVMGDSIGSADGQLVMHIPITGTKTGVEHVGSNIVFFNTANNKQVQLRNPLIDLKSGVINAAIPQSTGQSTAVLSITNASELKAKVTNDRKAKLRTTAYAGAKLSLALGIAAAVTSLLGLPEGSLPEGLAFATADVTLYSKIPAKK
ncbi:MAG: hypothetical protein ACKO8C_00935 [Candidatus Nanopelagicaceae bacterium]